MEADLPLQTGPQFLGRKVFTPKPCCGLGISPRGVFPCWGQSRWQSNGRLGSYDLAYSAAVHGGPRRGGRGALSELLQLQLQRVQPGSFHVTESDEAS